MCLGCTEFSSPGNDAYLDVGRIDAAASDVRSVGLGPPITDRGCHRSATAEFTTFKSSCSDDNIILLRRYISYYADNTPVGRRRRRLVMPTTAVCRKTQESPGYPPCVDGFSMLVLSRNIRNVFGLCGRKMSAVNGWRSRDNKECT